MPRISVETEYDKVIDTLSLSKATCIWKLRKHICHACDCESCVTCERQNEVYSSLAIADQLAVDNKTLNYAGRMVASIKKEEDEWEENIIFLLKIIVICGLVLFIFL